MNGQTQTRTVDDYEGGESGADKCRKCGIVHQSKEDMRLIQSGLGGILKFKRGRINSKILTIGCIRSVMVFILREVVRKGSVRQGLVWYIHAQTIDNKSF